MKYLKRFNEGNVEDLRIKFKIINDVNNIKKFFEENLMYLIDVGYTILVLPKISEGSFIITILLPSYPGAKHTSDTIKYDDIKYDIIPFYSLLVDKFDVISAILVTKFPHSAGVKGEGVNIENMDVDDKFDDKIRYIEIELKINNI
jgi:hypothetical protein